MKKDIKIQGFKTFNKNLRKTKGGGVAILVRDNLTCHDLCDNHIYKVLECQEIKIEFNQNKSIILISIYIPPNTSNISIKEDFERLINKYKNEKDIIIGGDVNCQNEVWSELEDISITHLTRSKILIESMIDSNFYTLNTGECTYISDKNQNESALDISITSTRNTINFSWEVLRNKIISDHFPIIISSADITSKKEMKIISKFNIQKFKNSLNLNNCSNIEDLTKTIDKCRVENTKTHKINTQYTHRIWWNDDIKKYHRLKLAAMSIYNHRKSTENFIAFKKARAKLKLEIKKAKKKSWQKFTSEISPEMKITEMWNRIKIIKGFKSDTNQNKNNLIRSNPNLMKQFLAKNFSNDSIQITQSRKIKLPVTFWERDLEFWEIQKTIQNKKSTAPGHDKISYEMIKALDEKQLSVIHNTLNNEWLKGKVREDWKKILIITILKPGKDPNDIGNYRPIALICTFVKIINSIILERINQFVTENNLLPDSTFGFRKNRSTSTCLNELTQIIFNNKSKNLQSIVLFLDISKAYDNVNINKLKSILDNCLLPPRIINWLISFLTCREIFMSSNSESASVITSKGIPQGDPISPCLFNLYTRDLHTNNNKNFPKILQYADDLVVIASAKTLTEAEQMAKRGISWLINKLRAIDLEINKEKSVAFLPFSKPSLKVNLEIQSYKIPQTNEHKFLGVIFDKNFNFMKHCQMIRENCNGRMNILKSISGLNHGAHPKNLIYTYRALIRSRIEYAAPVVANGSQSALKLLDTVNNQALKIALGALTGTATHILYAEASEIPLKFRREYIAMKELIKAKVNRINVSWINTTNNTANTFMQKTGTEFQNVINQMSNTNKIVEPRQLENLSISTKIANKNINKKHENVHNLKTQIREMIDLDFQHWNKLFTDGSKMGDKIGGAVYDTNKNNSIKFKIINENIGIMSAELQAIYEAINLGLREKYHNIVIFTDSKSSCQSILNKNHITHSNLLQNILQTISDNICTNFHIQWIPGHFNIKENEIADKLAKESIINGNEILTPYSTSQILKLIQDKCFTKWESEYASLSNQKGKFHKKNS